ncbi:diguanylate cyclase [Sporosarcina sp. Te-1]|nr:diguanylate cyclase [Sporosarcina sp. Te-1]
MAEQIREDIEQNPLRLKEFELRITASFGASCFHKEANTVNAILQKADQALYASKAAGRNVVYVAAIDELVPLQAATKKL